jgi:hypothetical protein
VRVEQNKGAGWLFEQNKGAGVGAAGVAGAFGAGVGLLAFTRFIIFVFVLSLSGSLISVRIFGKIEGCLHRV